jgi:hypothetical protein
LTIDAVTLPLLLVGIYFDEISGSCAKAYKQARSLLTLLKARLRARH